MGFSPPYVTMGFHYSTKTQHVVYGYLTPFYFTQVKYEPSEIPEHKLSLVSEMGDTNHMNQLLDNILIPRVVGTEGHTQVKKFIIKTMRNLKWHVETDPFEDKTPNMGTLKFENIIASLNPDADRFLILACHYDSKYFKDQEFLGATDSAGEFEL